MTAVGPPGWTRTEHTPRTVRRGREVAATIWSYHLDRDYDGWRHADWYWFEADDGEYEGDRLADPAVSVRLFEMPTVHFDRANTAEVEFVALEGVEDEQL